MLREACKASGVMGQVILIPKQVRDILDILHGAGYEAYVVGGCVRDALLARKPQDWDITTNATPQTVRKLFRRTVPTGIAHGTVTVLNGKTGYEVTTYRVDGVYEDARHPKDVTFTKSLEEDLKRRDFTINAMAYNDADGLVDLFEGARDLEKKIVRCVGNPKERFSEDALRMMRAYRFAAQLGFAVEKQTADAAVALADTLQKISAERIRDELVKLLCSDHPEKISDLYEAGLTKWFLPEFDRCMETAQNNPHHVYSVGEHTVLALCAVRNDPALRLAMLLHDIARPAGAVLRRLKFDNKTIKRVKNLVEHHDITIGRELTPQTVRGMMHTVGREDFPLLLEVMEADNAAKAPEVRTRLEEETKTLRSVYEQIVAANDPIELKDLAVTGTDLMACGIPAGEEIGALLKRMLRDVLKNPAHNTKAYLLAPDKLLHFRKMQDKKA